MRKFFSLFSGKSVHPAPGVKVIEASEFSTLEEAASIVQLTKEEAENYKKEIFEEAEKIKENAFKEGFQEGLTSLNQHLFALDKELTHLRVDIQKKILPLALMAAKKIMGEELRLHPDRIVDIVLTSLKPVTQHKKIHIFVNKVDLQNLEENKTKLKQIFEHLESLTIQERGDIEPGGCMIETEAGIINAQLENQWRALEAAFESFNKK